MEKSKLISYAYRLLARQDYSEFKLRQKLELRCLDHNLIQDVVEDLKKSGYLREEAYARIKVKSRLKQAKSANFIRSELAQENISISNQEIEEIASEYQINHDEIIRRQIEKKIRNIKINELDFEAKFKLKNKVLSSLVRLGHSFSDCNKYLKEYF